LHLEGGAGVPGVETNDLKPQSAKFMHEPWRHRASLDPNAGVISRMSAHRSGDLFRRRGALTPPQSKAGIVDDANGRHLLRNVQTDKVGHVEAPMVRITGRRRPDRGTIERSGAHRDYRMSTYEAMSRPGMRFVPIKSAEQQATLMLHKTRELLIKQRTMSVNALRGHLSEFGIVAAKGIGRVDELLDLAESDATLPAAAKMAMRVLAQALEGLDKAIDDLEKEISSAQAQNEMSRLLDKVPGIGKLIASVIAACVPDPSVFKSGRDFAAWLGLTPRQNSSGGKPTLGAITKQGNRYIRKLLVLGATSLLNVVGKRKGALRDWIFGLLAKKPARLVTVALANKLARILWAMMKTGECFRTEMFAKA
jgi:transposase